MENLDKIIKIIKLYKDKHKALSYSHPGTVWVKSESQVEEAKELLNTEFGENHGVKVKILRRKE
jgi:hypothetical protein